jgi:hypothetical protein
MDLANVKIKNNLDLLVEELKHNVNKETFLDTVLEAVYEIKKTEYDNGEVRNFFYNLVFETVFCMNEDYSYVTEYIAFFKSNVPFYLERFEAVINNLKNGTIHFDNAGETSTLDEEFWEANAVASTTESTQKQYVRNDYQIQEQEIASDDTMVLDASFWSERQQLFTGKEQMSHQPYLMRISNEERIEIDKPVYSIGKDRNLVDYVIEANSVISRRHAEIITKGRHYFICDKCSTNKTYVEDKEIPEEEVIEIFNGTRFKLANEEFTFYI